MKLEWSEDALADLDRFAGFLQDKPHCYDGERLMMLRIFHGRENW